MATCKLRRTDHASNLINIVTISFKINKMNPSKLICGRDAEEEATLLVDYRLKAGKETFCDFCMLSVAELVICISCQKEWSSCS